MIRHALEWRQSQIDAASKVEEVERRRRCEGVQLFFCHLAIETLKQLNVHPIPERDIQTILNLAFEQFETCSDNIISELYAEALGVLSDHRHHQVRLRFLAELRKLRSTESSTEKIASILDGMRYFKVKMYPIEDFTESVHFLKEVGDYFHDAIDAKDKDWGKANFPHKDTLHF